MEWINFAVKNLHAIRIFSFNKMNKLVLIKSLKGSNTNLEYIPRSIDIEARTALMKVCNNIGTDFPNDDLFNILKKDFATIQNATSLYFSGYFDINGRSRLQIKGLEAWIVELFVNKIKNTEHTSDLLPIYLFSEDVKCWCQLNSNFKWIHIIRPPKPQESYIGLSSDPISIEARIEISLL